MRALTTTVCFLVLLSTAVSGFAGEVVVLRVEDTIQPASRQFIERALEEADEREAGLVVLELDTPGGLLDSTREITTAITTSTVPVVVYVAPAGARAASAGFFLLMAADVAAMAPGTNTGAAHPVGGQGEDIEGHIGAKVTNDASAMVRSLAEQRERNVDEAVKAVTESTSYTAEEALKAELIDMVVGDLDKLFSELQGREVTRFSGDVVTLDFDSDIVVRVEPTPAERFLSVLANPNIAYLLMALGMLGIYVEVTHPGAIFPGAVGTIAILLALYSVSVLPVSLTGVALIFVAMVLFLLEVKVTSYGLLTIGGLISFVLGSLMLFDSPIPDMRVSVAAVLPTALLIAGVTGFLLTRVLKAHSRKPFTGYEGLVGEIGQALGAIDGKGKVLVHGEYWDARSLGGAIESGADVRVAAISGRCLDVESAEGPAEGG